MKYPRAAYQLIWYRKIIKKQSKTSKIHRILFCEKKMGNVLGGCKDSREPKNNADHGKPNTVTNHYTNTTAFSGNDSKKTTEESCCKGTS